MNESFEQSATFTVVLNAQGMKCWKGTSSDEPEMELTGGQPLELPAEVLPTGTVVRIFTH